MLKPHFLSNYSERILYDDVDVMIDDIENEIHPGLTRNSFVALYYLLNNMIGISGSLFYTGFLFAMLYRKSTFGYCDKLMMLYLIYQILTFSSNIILQKMSFRVGNYEYYAIQTYQMIPSSLANTLDHFLRIQYVLYWYLISAILVFRMLTFSTQNVKIHRLFHIYFIPFSAFTIMLFLFGSAAQLEIVMLGVTFIIWCTHRRHMVAHLYSLGLSRRDILNSKKMNVMYSLQLIFSIFFNFVKYGSVYTINASLRTQARQDVYTLYWDQFFNSIICLMSVFNACIFLWATKDYFNGKPKQTNVLPITATYNLTAGNFSRRPSTVSTYSISASPVPSISPVNPNMLHP
ncbi:unnamed protein product [Caenorhabditis angaria]|uniref:Uncharacterized protein n=1 Tax=Caenorhabditis angaria TaxID=860376 RepID=A0A9P1J735_9PELO|nr:unnamed protein product [Caenorhabditis angaria]